MYPGGFTAEVTNLSPKATEKDVYDFFVHCGEVEHVEIVRSGEYACAAYVTFRDPYALETAILLSGATIVDQRVCIILWGAYVGEYDPWNNPSWKVDEYTIPMGIHANEFVSTPGEAVTMAQEIVTTMISKGYVLGKDALIKAKAFDESHQVSATAAAKIAELSKRLGLTDKIYAGMEAVKSIDVKHHAVEITKSAASVTGTAAVSAATFTGRTAVAAANAAINSTYFARGALWVSSVLSRAAQATADFGNKASK